MAFSEGPVEAFAGQWEDAAGTVLTIAGSSITQPDGRVQQLVFEGEKICKFTRGNNVYEGKLSDDTNSLTWPGDIIWTRRGASRNMGMVRPKLNLEQALSMQRELHKGFSDPEFQGKLQELQRLHGANQEVFLAERAKLFLTIQGPVLLRYDFEDSQKGVIDMLDAGAHFNGNAEYVKNREQLNALLGMVDWNCGRSVVVRHLLDAGELKVELPRCATFLDLKKALSKLAASDEIVTKGLLIRKEDDGALASYRDADQVGSTQEVVLFRAGLPAQQSPNGAAEPAQQSPNGAAEPAHQSPNGAAEPAHQSPNGAAEPAQQSPNGAAEPAQQTPN